MGLRDLLGVGKRSEAKRAAENSSGLTNVLNEEVPSAASSSVTNLDTEPITS